MSTNHHPSEPVLTAYAAGTLADGPSLVVAAHLERCSRCRAELKLYEAVGGALIAELEPVAMADDALALALARIERPEPAAKPPLAVRGLEGVTLPKAVARRGVGRRRFVGPGIWVAQIPSQRPDGWRTYLLRAPAGIQVPHHGHHGEEFTMVLQGAIRDETGLYEVGDFAEADPEIEHHPESAAGDACVCLISGQGGIKASGILKWVQPLLGV